MSKQADTATSECIDVDAPAGRSSAWRALSAPWGALWSPSRAAERMVNCGPVAAIASIAAYGALLASAIVCLALFSATLTLEATGKWSTRSELQVWNDWHDNTRFGPAEIIFCAVLAGVLILAAVCAWTYLPTVHRAGSIRRSYFRAVCAVAACIAVLLVTSLVVGTVFTLSLHDRWGAIFGTHGASSGIPKMLGPAAIPLGVCLVLWTVGRAVRGVPDDTPDLAIGPRCERCGYDLTYVGQDNLCSECGTDAGESLEPNRWRPGCVWEERRGFESWAVTSAAVLFDPTRFYSRLRLRTPDRRARAFAAWHFFSVAAAVGVWGCITLTIAAGGFPTDAGELVLVPCMIMSMVLCLAWGVRRLAAAIGASWLLYLGEPADFRWVRRVIEYETAYLWLFCVFNGLMITVAVVMPGLVRIILLQRAFFWMPLGPVLAIFGNLGLGLIWIWRYRIASRAIRWSNF